MTPLRVVESVQTPRGGVPGGKGGLTKPEVVGHPAVARLVLVGLHRLPDVPAPHGVQPFLRLRPTEVLDLRPVEERGVDGARHARDIENAGEGEGRLLALDVRREGWEDGHRAGSASEVDQVRLHMLLRTD